MKLMFDRKNRSCDWCLWPSNAVRRCQLSAGYVYVCVSRLICIVSRYVSWNSSQCHQIRDGHSLHTSINLRGMSSSLLFDACPATVFIFGLVYCYSLIEKWLILKFFSFEYYYDIFNSLYKATWSVSIYDV